MPLQIVATIGLLLVNSVGPGLLFIRYLRWRPLETLCGSVALSFLLLYLSALAIYLLRLSPACAYAPTALAAGATLACARDIRQLWRNRQICVTIVAFLTLFSWLVLLLLLPRGYSGGRWYGDWYEHFHRARFFAEHLPFDTKFLNVFVVPARPPMMNLLTAAIFWQVSPSFEVMQVVFAYLNALVLLPCTLIAPSLVSRTRNRALLIAGLLALSPMFVQNATYTWTKLFASFYVLTALGLYLSAWRRNDSTRMIAAVACFAAGMLVHYSIAPLIVFLAAHYLLVLFRRRPDRWRELVASTALGLAIFGTWVTWSIYAFGTHDTFASNTTVLSSQQFSWWQNVVIVGQNIYYTVVPAVVRGGIEHDVGYNAEVPPRELAYLRDWCFAIYQPSFPAALGVAGLTLVIWLLAKTHLRRSDAPRQPGRGFWLCLFVTVLIVGVAVIGVTDYLGVAHICLQPLLLLALTFAAVGLPHVPRWFREIALVALLIDAGLGISLHFYLLQTHHEVSRVGERVTVSHSELGMSAINNALLKSDFHVTFLGDHAADYAGILLGAMVIGILAIRQGLSYLGGRSAPVDVRIVAAAKPSKSAAAHRKRKRKSS